MPTNFALERFVNALLPVRDSMEMGLIAASEERADVAKLREGAELTLKLMADVMDKFDVAQIDPPARNLHPNCIRPCRMVPRRMYRRNTVVIVVQKGYTLNGRLVRPAMVMVSQTTGSMNQASINGFSLKKSGHAPSGKQGLSIKIILKKVSVFGDSKWENHRHRPGNHQLLRGGDGRQSAGSSKTARVIAPPRPSWRSGDGEVLVGQSAKRQAVTNLRIPCLPSKRLIGRRFGDDVVKRDMDMVPYKIVKADNGDAWIRRMEKMAPPEVSAKVLQKMKDTAGSLPGRNR